MTISRNATMSQVASSASAVTLLAANAGRLQAAIFNDSTAVLYVGLGGQTPTSGLYWLKMNAGAYAELPSMAGQEPYTGIIKGIWASANGNAQLTEFTP